MNTDIWTNVCKIISRQISPQVRRDGIKNIIFPEQIPPQDLAKLPDCPSPCDMKHKEHELGIGLTGNPTYCVDGKVLTLSRGKMLFIPAGTPHGATQKIVRFTTTPDPTLPSSILWFTAHPFGVQMQLSFMAENDEPCQANWRMFMGRHFASLMDQLLEELRSASYEYDHIGKYVLLEFLHRCIRAIRQAEQMAMTLRRKAMRNDSKPLPDRIQAAREYIFSNYYSNITLDDIAAAADCSVSYLTQHFKAATGRTPMQYLLAVRMKVARELLATNMKIHEIATVVGLPDPAYFSRVFTRFHKVSPMEYRKKQTQITSPSNKSARLHRKRNVK